MKNTKKLLALALSVAMILSVVLACPVTSLALEGFTSYNANPRSIDGTDGYTYIHMYPTPESTTGAVGGGYYNGNAKTLAQIQADGAFYKGKTPYVTYYILADQDIAVDMGAAYSAGGTSDGQYAMVLDINDEDYIVGSRSGGTSGTAGGASEGGDMFYDVQLKKGVNIVRMLPTAKAANGSAVWCDIKSLLVENNEHVTVLKTSQLGQTTYYPKNSAYKTGYNNDGDGVGGCYNNGTAYANYDWSNKDVHSNFSVTVNAPRDGYYDVEFRMNCGTIGTHGKIAAFVDGHKNWMPFYDFDNSRSEGNNVSGSAIYLTAGTHVLTFTEGMDRSNSGTWFNYGLMTFFGGLTVADTQINPADLASGDVVFADKAGYIEHGKVNTEKLNNQDHTKVSFFQSDVQSGIIQSFADMKANGFSDHNAVTVTYNIKADKAGMYTIAPWLQVGGTLAPDFFMGVIVNDKTGDYCAKTSTITASGEFPVTVKFDEGVNFVRLVLICAETQVAKRPNDSMWMNHGYIRLCDGLEGVKYNGTRQTKVTGNSFVVGNYNIGDNGSLGGAGQNLGKLNGLTSDAVTAADIAKVPHFAATVSVPVSGYYDFSLDVTCDANDKRGIINVFVDDVKDSNYYYQTKQWNSSAALLVWIPAGIHTLTFTSVCEWAGSQNKGFATWCDYYCLNAYGDITFMPIQLDPTKDINAYKADFAAQANGAKVTGDPTDVDSALAGVVGNINSYAGGTKSKYDQVVDLKAIAETAPKAAADARVAAFPSAKVAAKADADAVAAIYPAGDSAEIIATAKGNIDTVSYDSAKSYADNKAALAAFVSAAGSDVQALLDADVNTFNNTRKPAIKNQINIQAQDGDSAICAQLISDALAAVDTVQYDINKNLNNNVSSGLTPILSTLKTSLANQRGVDAFKGDEEIVADEAAVEGDTAAAAALIAAAKEEIANYVYDNTKSAEENEAAVKAINTNLETALAANRQAVEDQLHVWRQYQNGITAESESAFVRFIFTLDTLTNDYLDYGFYINIDGDEVKYSFKDYELDVLGVYDALYFDNSDKANKIVYVYVEVSNDAFATDILAKAYFTDEAGEHIGGQATANVANKFGF